MEYCTLCFSFSTLFIAGVYLYIRTSTEDSTEYMHSIAHDCGWDHNPDHNPNPDRDRNRNRNRLNSQEATCYNQTVVAGYPDTGDAADWLLLVLPEQNPMQVPGILSSQPLVRS